MKFPLVFLTTFAVLLSSLILVGTVSDVQAQTTSFTLNKNQSVTTIMPTTQKWNLVYQLNPSTPVVSAIQYQPELHTFVTENFTPDILLAEAMVPESIATVSAKVVASVELDERAKKEASPSATLITIDKSESLNATPAAIEKPTTKIATRSAVPVVLPPSDLDALFEKYASEYGLSASVIKHIAKCESGLRPEALSSNGLYGGLFQFVASTWSGNRKSMGLDPDPQLRFNAEEAIKTAAYKISRDGYGAWPVCGKKAIASI